MSKSIEVDVDQIYKSWRAYLKAESDAKYFGMIFDPTKQSKFPYANLRLVGRPTNGSDLDGDELSVQLTFETEGYINTSKYLTLYGIDQASADFFLQLGFTRVGDSAILKVSDTVTKITSRFLMMHFCGDNFLSGIDPTL